MFDLYVIERKKAVLDVAWDRVSERLRDQRSVLPDQKGQLLIGIDNQRIKNNENTHITYSIL